ncbi:ssDNA-binding domain-containing protein [Bradyrhizobium sp. 41S5]|uniref:ArdC-like ssDNA-binding domain-containing protein n=1 Tax=Bradyrhizobium sp. 41S5 TaxID=1404443 RepID=UPI00156AF04F|nr:ArdC-like ssDNA-binding domain-containing protein [Bradyrhizobium sp. 41S5]UFX42091.1 ssDNA-binding domain-containing protein [Bradyrhizobium sp. 41S5]
MRKPNPNKEKAAQLARQIANMTEEQKALWLQRAPILTADARPISGKNHMLAAMQCEGATMLGGFNQWLAAGRAVRKGESAIYIFAPSGRRATAEASAAPSADGAAAEAAAESVRFILVPVFDVSQTDEKPAEQAAAA